MPPNIKPTTRSLTPEELEKLVKSAASSVSAIKNIKQPLPSKEEVAEEKKSAKFYLPVLRLNDPTQWDSKPLSERKHFTNEVAKATCVGKCCGYDGLKAGCCQLDPEDIEHVLGPLDEEWIKKTIKWFRKKGINVTRHDIVIDFEEGRLIGQAHFNNHPVFLQKDSYPILRIQASGIRFSCKFLNVSNGMCTIYEQRPDMCKDYYCSYVKSNFLVRTKNHPNTYKKIDIGNKEEEKEEKE